MDGMYTYGVDMDLVAGDHITAPFVRGHPPARYASSFWQSLLGDVAGHLQASSGLVVPIRALDRACFPVV